jgi:hypothetical protein
MIINNSCKSVSKITGSLVLLFISFNLLLASVEAKKKASSGTSSSNMNSLHDLPFPVPELPGSKSNSHLTGNAENNLLQAGTKQDLLQGNIETTELETLDPRDLHKKPVLQGSATLNTGNLTAADPDAGDQELQVEWDRWRNRFLRAVQLSVQEKVNNPDQYERPRINPMTGMIMPRFPLGTVAWFSCQITNDGRIANLDIFESSGFKKYDQAVLSAISDLEGTSILRFPRGSKRRTVTQEAGIKTATSADYRYHHFGDIERYRMPAP